MKLLVSVDAAEMLLTLHSALPKQLEVDLIFGD